MSDYFSDLMRSRHLSHSPVGPVSESFQPWSVPSKPNRRKVFVSHYHGHSWETDSFLRDFGDVFIRKTVGALGDENFIKSPNPDYVMQCIRDDYIGDSTVTIVLVGTCTHSRRYVDWEIKGSLQRSGDGFANGLLAIQMPSAPNGAFLPPRLELNWNGEHRNCYARYYRYPQSTYELREWIEDAFDSRMQRSQWIKNPHDTMFAYDRRCNVCGIAHQ